MRWPANLTLPRAPRPALAWLLAMLIIAGAAAPVLFMFMVNWPGDQWQVDVEVYREAGVSILWGRPIYATLTENPQLLPFTYPPFAALLALPLGLLPFHVVGWLWAGLQIVATTAIVWYAGWRLIHRAGGWAPVALALLTAPMLWLHPVADGLRFGQVNAFMVLACLMDLRDPRPRVLARVPRGVLVGLAMSVKLTPGVFVVHFLVTKRWKEAATAVVTAVLATLGTWLVLPDASFAFWGGALQDPERLGPNAVTSNQSLRGLVLRLGPEGTAGSVLWLGLVVVVGVAGYALARHLWLAGDSIGEVAAVGLMACLLSPVAWIHHLHWMVVVIVAVLGWDPLRERSRLICASVLTVWFLCRMPWWAGTMPASPDWRRFPGHLLQNADLIGALLALWMLWYVQRRRPLAQGEARVRERLAASAGPP